MVDAKDLHWICSVPLGATIAAFGILGNIISILIWQRIIKSKLRGNQSTALYLIALGVCDTGLLVFFLLTDTIKANHPEIVNNYSYAAFFSWFGFPIFFIFLVASIWLVVGVTLNRFFMITFPTKVKSMYTTNRTYMGIAVFLAFSVIINIPHFFSYHPKETNGTYTLALTEYGESQGSIDYEFWVHCIFVVLAPWFTIAVLNASIVYKLTQQMKKFNSKKDSKGSSKRDKQEKQMTRMLLAVTFSFLVLLAWQCVTQCFWMLGVGKEDKNSSRWNLIDSSFAFAKTGVVINSSINWIFYCLTGTMFRKEMMKMLPLTRIKRGSFTTSSNFKSTTKATQDTVFANSNV